MAHLLWFYQELGILYELSSIELKLRFFDHFLSVVRPSIRKHFVQNHGAKFNQPWHKALLFKKHALLKGQ